MRSTGLATILLTLALLAPAASATSGRTRMTGELELGNASLDAPMYGLLLDDTSSLHRFTLTAPRVIVHKFTIEYPNLPVVRIDHEKKESSTYPLTDVHVSLADGTQEGWLGAYGDPGASLLTPGTSSVQLRASTQSILSNGVGEPEDAPRPDDQQFVRALKVPHFVASTQGPFVLAGPRSEVKIHGADITIQARENTTTFRTGAESTPTSITAQWLLLEVEGGRLDVDCGCEAHALIQAPVRAAWSTLDGFATGAHLDDGGRASYDSSNETFRVAGRFASQITVDSTMATQPAALLTMDGDLSSTSAHVSSTSAPFGRSQWLFIGAIAAAASLGAAAYARSRSRRALTAEDYADLTARAIEHEDHAQALEWVRKARRAAPTSHRLMIDEAYVLEQLQEPDAALALYQEAAEHSTTGEADMMRARLLVRLGRISEAVPALDAALRRDAWLVLDLETDPAFAPVRHDPRAERLARDARRRLDV